MNIQNLMSLEQRYQNDVNSNLLNNYIYFRDMIQCIASTPPVASYTIQILLFLIATLCFHDTVYGY